MVCGMRLPGNVGVNGLIALTVLSIAISLVSCAEPEVVKPPEEPKEEEYAKQSGYPGSDTSKGTELIYKYVKPPCCLK